MIVVSLGTHNQDFSRLAKAIDEFALTTTEHIVVQTGFTKYNFKNIINTFDYCSKSEMDEYIKSADIVILQGGWGAIEEAIDLGKRIVAVPRIEGLEHVHNQEQLVRKLETLNCLIGCYDIKELPKCILKAKTYNFKKLKKGNAYETINLKLNEWFK